MEARAEAAAAQAAGAVPPRAWPAMHYLLGDDELLPLAPGSMDCEAGQHACMHTRTRLWHGMGRGHDSLRACKRGFTSLAPPVLHCIALYQNMYLLLLAPADSVWHAACGMCGGRAGQEPINACMEMLRRRNPLPLPLQW